MSDLKPQARLDYDLVMLGSTIALMIIGILFIYSSGVTSEGILVSNEYIKQIIWAGLGVGLLILLSFIDYAKLRDYAPYIYGIFIIILIYTRFFGRLVNGARSWVGIGEIGIQPSEFMKLATILFLARFLNDSKRNMRDIGRVLVSCLIVGIPMLLILIQPDFGTSLVFLPILLGMLFISGVRLSYIAYIALLIGLTGFFTVIPFWQQYILKRSIPFFQLFTEAPYSYLILIITSFLFAMALMGYLMTKKKYSNWLTSTFFWLSFYFSNLALSIGLSSVAGKVLKEYQIRRLIVFLDPSIDPRGSGWNIIQSMTAIGSGGFFGKGFLQGTQSHYRFLPQQSTDFIFSIISEEIGFWGCMLIFSLFFIILYRCLFIIKNVRDGFAVLLAAGMASMFFFHFIINVGMAMGIMPITGIPLFFLSYGGSSLWTALSGIGLMLSIYIRRFRQ